MIRNFRDLPLGTRFKYIDGKDTWVVLDRENYGLIAKWQGNDGPTWGQAICSAADTEKACKELTVEVVEL